MNNPQRTVRLIDITNNINLSYKIVAEADELELEILDQALDQDLEGPLNSFLFVGSIDYYSICQIKKETYRSSQVIVLECVSGLSPMNWSKNLYKEADQKYGLSGHTIYVRSPITGRDQPIPLDF